MCIARAFLFGGFSYRNPMFWKFLTITYGAFGVPQISLRASLVIGRIPCVRNFVWFFLISVDEGILIFHPTNRPKIQSEMHFFLQNIPFSWERRWKPYFSFAGGLAYPSLPKVDRRGILPFSLTRGNSWSYQTLIVFKIL